MSSPRIIAGKARGVHLKSVPGEGTRPITDRVKEALFNILGADIHQANLLDLFAGTGSVGIEALSRGASFVRLIDHNPKAIETIKTNLDHTRLAGQADVIRVDAFHYLKQSPDRAFHYIFIAPPQYKDLWLQALMGVDDNPGWLTQDSWVIVQIDPVEYKPVSLANLVEFDQRRYGSTLLVFYERT
jgi:16S rRNA (guanine(966)-N(2))-methyltransferase RsmD